MYFIHHYLRAKLIFCYGSDTSASHSTDAPMRFVNLKQKNGQPTTPAALVAVMSSGSVFGVSYYRDYSYTKFAIACATSVWKLKNVLDEYFPNCLFHHYLITCICILNYSFYHHLFNRFRLSQPLFDFEVFKLKWGLGNHTLFLWNGHHIPSSKL